MVFHNNNTLLGCNLKLAIEFGNRAVAAVTVYSARLATGPADEHFSNITMALPVGGEVWIGTFGGDRVGYRSLKKY